MIIYRWVLLRMRISLDKSCTENQNTHCIFNKIFFLENPVVYEIMWKNVVRPYRQHMKIWRMHITCWITRATNTHTEYVIFLSNAATVPRTALNVHCLSCRRLPRLLRPFPLRSPPPHVTSSSFIQGWRGTSSSTFRIHQLIWKSIRQHTRNAHNLDFPFQLDVRLNQKRKFLNIFTLITQNWTWISTDIAARMCYFRGNKWMSQIINDCPT